MTKEQKILERANAIIEAHEFWNKDQKELWNEVEKLKKQVDELKNLKKLGELIYGIKNLFGERHNNRSNENSIFHF